MSRRPAATVPDHFELLARLARTATEDLELQPMLQRITDVLHRELDFELVALVSLDTEQQRFRCEALSTALPTEIFVGYSRPLGSGVVGQAAALGQTVLVSDASAWPDFVHTLPGGQSELAVPIRFGGQTLAVLNLESTRTGAFDGLVELIESVAAQLAGSIAAAQRLALLDRRTALLEAVAATVREALEAPDLVSLCDRLLGTLSERLQLAEATILLESDLKDHLQVVAHRGASPHISFRGKLWPVAEGVVGRCFRTGEAQWIAQIGLDADYALVNPRVQAEFAVPIRYRDRVFGVLNLEAERAQAFDQLERVAIRALADQAGGALHLGLTNQRLQDSLRRMQSQDNQLERTRESLKRAVGKLKRRQGFDTQSGVANRESLLDWLRREAVALRRGGRCSGLLLLHWTTAPPLANAIGLLEQLLGGVRGRIAQATEQALAVVLSAPDRGLLQRSFEQAWSTLETRLQPAGAALLLVEAPARVLPEAWLSAAQLSSALPPTVRSFATA